MKPSAGRQLLIATIVASLFTAALPAQDLSVPDQPGDESAEPAREREAAIPGLVFNTNNIILDLLPYLGGFGGKLLYEDSALRGMVSAGYQSTTGTLDLGTAIAYEKPFYRGRINPYYGVTGRFDFSTQYSETGDEDWTRVSASTVGIGGILGVELFIVDYVSLFAEYELLGRGSWTSVKQSIAGELIEPEPTVNYDVGLGLGNQASIGIVIYLKPTGLAPREERP